MLAAQIIKYKDYINNLKSTINLDERDINNWCDLIELLCLTNPDKEFFREDLERDIESLVDGGLQLASLKEISEQMSFDLTDSHIFLTSGRLDWGSNDSARNDLLNQLTNMWFSHLQLRQREFKGFYPFKVEKDGSKIICKPYKKLSKKNKLYLHLLLTAQKNGFNKSLQTHLSFDFEPIAFESFKCLIPKKAEAYLLGKGPYSTARFKKLKHDKFSQLASILNIKMKVSIAYFHPKDTGENGIDFIGWQKYDNTLPNNSVFAGQATCMSNWSKKYNESSVQEMGGILDTSNVGSYVNSLFIPYHFKVGRNWAYSTYVDAKNYILFDRFRILNNLNTRKINNIIVAEELIKAIA